MQSTRFYFARLVLFESKYFVEQQTDKANIQLLEQMTHTHDSDVEFIAWEEQIQFVDLS